MLEEPVQRATASQQPVETVNHTATRYWMRSPAGRALAAELPNRLQGDLADDVEWVGPVYRVENEEGPKAFVAPLPNVLIVKPARGDERAAAELPELLESFGLEEVPEKSRYLGELRYFQVNDPARESAYDIRNRLLESGLVEEAHFEYMPMIKPTALSPNDPLFAQQWDMVRIQAGGAGATGWDISAGNNTVVVCVLDEGCDLTHPDLQFSTPGINLGTMLPDGSPTGNHGTACAGIAAGSFNNTQGVAGVAGGCLIMPLAFVNWTDVEVAAGINYARTNGAHVISMSFGWNPWNPAVIDPAIAAAHAANVVMCVATHNYNGPITYPATNPLVIACGASDQVDNRKSPASPDGEPWGSNFGPEIDVVAPGVLIPTTDRQGNAGYNPNPGAGGNYHLTFNGTSSATPHVAGLAALLRSQYPALTNVQVRAIIERTANKVGTVPYAEVPGRPNGTWNQEMGHGRINVLRSLDFADVMIGDYPGDIGNEPSTPPGGDFWDFSDIVIRPSDDNVFNPGDPNDSSRVERGQTNYLYVRVTNRGPREARNVAVNARITPYVGLEFVYPTDWMAIDAMHVSPAPVTTVFGTLPAGATVIAKFSISATQVEDLWGWSNSHPWHPCLLASVTADNDYAFASLPVTGTGMVVKRNNFAQRNLSVIDVVAGASVAFPFVAGNLRNQDRSMETVIDLRRMPKEARTLLALDEGTRAFPHVIQKERDPRDIREHLDDLFVFLERSILETTWGGRKGLLTLEKGSHFSLPPGLVLNDKVEVQGGEVLLRGGKRFVELRDFSPAVKVEKEPGRLYVQELHVQIPPNARSGQRYTARVTQRNSRGETIGGATVIYRVK